VLTLRWAGSPLLWPTLVLVLLRLSGWIGGAVVVHCPVLQRSTTGWSCHNLSLLGFLVGADCIVYDHDIADELWKCPSSVERHALLQLGGETDHKVVLLLLVRIHLVQRILRQVVELLGVVMHGPSACFRSMNSCHFFLIMPTRM
jgi:hypothetical protein